MKYIVIAKHDPTGTATPAFFDRRFRDADTLIEFIGFDETGNEIFEIETEYDLELALEQAPNLISWRVA